MTNGDKPEGVAPPAAVPASWESLADMPEYEIRATIALMAARIPVAALKPVYRLMRRYLT